MTKEFDEGEFWLPSSLLYSEEHRRCSQAESSVIPVGLCPEPYPFVYGRKQDLLRQVKLAGAHSQEQEDYIAWLSRTMALSFAQEEEDEQKKLLLWNKAKQSTPCGWPLPELKKGGLDGASVVPPSPFHAVEKREEEAWDLLSQAAEQVMRLRVADLERRRNFYELDLLNMARKQRSPPAAVSHAPPPSCRNATAGQLVSSAVSRQQHLQAVHYYRLKQMQSMKQQLSDRHPELRNGGASGSHCLPPAISPFAFHGKGSGNGTTAIPMNGPRKESKGTGVFLPRTPGTKSESHKRTASPAVHVPARVAQALNANLEELGAEPRFPSAGFALNRDAPVYWSNLLVDHKPPTLMKRTATGNITLPGEWTY